MKGSNGVVNISKEGMGDIPGGVLRLNSFIDMGHLLLLADRYFYYNLSTNYFYKL